MEEEQAYLEYQGHRFYRWFVHCRNRQQPLVAWGETAQAVKDEINGSGEEVLTVEPAPSPIIR